MISKLNHSPDKSNEKHHPEKINENNTWEALKETLKYDEFAEIYKDSLKRLRTAFPIIPNDLSNISVKIKYSFKDKFIKNRYLVNFSDNEIELKMWEKRYYLRSNGLDKPWICFADEEYWTVDRTKAMDRIEFNRSEFEKGIDDIINNVDKCEWLIQTRDWKSFSYKDFLWNDVYWLDAEKNFS